jgi:predicted HicB family RNase H-like nuclease
MDRKTLIISETTHQILKDFCKKNSIKLNDWVEKLILKEIKKEIKDEQ